MFNNFSRKKKSRPYGAIRKKHGTARQATDGSIIRRMRLACWVTTATNSHSEYVILIAFPRQQWLRTCASMLRHSILPVLS